MKKLILIILLLNTLSAYCQTPSTGTRIASQKIKKNSTKYYLQFQHGITEFLKNGNYSFIEKMFGDSGIYGADCEIDSCNVYESPLTPDEFKERLEYALEVKTENIIITRDINPCYNSFSYSHGTMFKFEILYTETGRMDDFKVYVSFKGELLNVTFNTNINIKGYYDGDAGMFYGYKQDKE